MHKKCFYLLFVSSLLILLTCCVQAQTYYTALTGSDGNLGTLSLPFRTIGKGVSNLNPGDTLYLRGGVYSEGVNIARSGTSTNPIRVMAYPGESPVDDGATYTVPGGPWAVLFGISGDYVQISGIEVRYSSGMGVTLGGKNDVADHINSHHNQQNGILILGDGGIVQNSQVWSNCMSNVNGLSTNGWASGLSAARHPNNAIIRNNTVYQNWGEGISTYEANGTILEDNTVYDSYSTNIYISDATNVVCQRNLVYATGTLGGVDSSEVGIMMGDEQYNPPSANIQVINNLVINARRNYYWWQGVQGGGMNNVLIAYNTFVNSSYLADVIIADGAHQNVRFMNNLVLQDGSITSGIISSSSQVTLASNLWSKAPNRMGTGDLVANPGLSKAGKWNNPSWFGLLPSSPAINKATILSTITTDFTGAARDSTPDIGALEYVTSTPQPGSLQFGASTYTVNENGGTVTISVKRSGGSSGAVSVSYATSTGTATAGSDYTTKSGTISWGDGDVADKSIAVSILEDSVQESTETFAIGISNPTGGASLGSPSAATISITDNDVTGAGKTYYVSSSGNDANNGSQAAPWKTIQQAANMVVAGDTVYIRGGVYRESVSWTASGTQSAPITVRGYPGETAVLDGNSYTIPSSAGNGLFTIWSSWYKVSDLEFRYSGDTAVTVAISSAHTTLSNIYVHHNWGGGVILSGNYSLAQNSRLWSNSMVNYNYASPTGWGSGISCARYPDYCTIRNVTSWENWGEGISTFEALHTTIEDCTSYDNQQNYYISDTKYSVLRRSLSYCTPGNMIDPYETQCGILVGDEKGVPIPLGPNSPRFPSSDNTIINNVVMGCNHNLAAGAETNNVYAFNTFVNQNGSTSEQYNVLFYAGAATNQTFANNIILQEDNHPISIASLTGMTFSYNLWSRIPTVYTTNMSSPTDIIGDPRLARSGGFSSGRLTADWFRILANSPAIGKAVPLGTVTTDFIGNPRGSSPDIGAFEYLDATFPLAGDVDGDGDVDMEDMRRVLVSLGTTIGMCPGCDLDGDHVVSLRDLSVVALHYGTVSA